MWETWFSIKSIDIPFRLLISLKKNNSLILLFTYMGLKRSLESSNTYGCPSIRNHHVEIYDLIKSFYFSKRSHGHQGQLGVQFLQFLRSFIRGKSVSAKISVFKSGFLRWMQHIPKKHESQLVKHIVLLKLTTLEERKRSDLIK